MMPALKFAAALFALLAFAPVALADIPPPQPPDPIDNLGEPVNGRAPDEFVKSIYEVKLTAEAIRSDLGRNTTSHIVLYYFTPDLLALFKTAVQSDEPVIDADMFMMAQDWDTKPDQVTTKIVTQDASSATVEAVVPNFGTARTLTYLLKKSKNGLWLIDDITDQSNGAGVRQMIAAGLGQPAAAP